MEVTILTEAEIRQCVQLNQEAIAAVESAFNSLDAGAVTMPPIMRVDIPEHDGEVDVKTATILGCDRFAIKISSGFFHNAELGLPSASGMMLLISARTGVPRAVLLDNGYLTDVRTGAAGAVAAKYLALEDVADVGVIGAGAQARCQILALHKVRPFRRLAVYGPTPQNVKRYAEDMASVLDGVTVRPAESAAEVVRESDVVVTTTPSKTPVIKAEWLHPGLHITAVGSDAEHKQELEAGVAARADLVACDSRAQCLRLGELHHTREAGLLPNENDVVELGAITSGRESGRTSDAQVTVCDLTGTGAQDTAIALLAAREATERGLGVRIDG